MNEKLPQDLNPTKLSFEDLDKLDNAALKHALQSVIRDPQAPMMHQDHRSHGNTSPAEQRPPVEKEIPPR